MPYSSLWDQSAVLAARPLARRAWESGLHDETIARLLDEGAVTQEAVRGALAIALSRLELGGWDRFLQRLLQLSDSPERDAAIALAALRDGDGARGSALGRRAVQRAGSADDASLAIALCVGLAHAQAERARWQDAGWFVIEGRRLLDAADDATRSLREWDLSATAVLIEWNTHSGSTEFDRLDQALRGLILRNAVDTQHAAALIALGGVEFRRGAYDDGAARIRRALQHLPKANSTRRITAGAELALIRLRQGRWQQGFDLASALPALVDDATPAHVRAVVAAAGTFEPALSLRFPAALEQWQRARAAVDEHWSVLGDVLVEHTRSIVLFAVEDFLGLLDYLDGFAAQPYRSIYTQQEVLAMRAAALANLLYVRRYRELVERWATLPGSTELPYYWTHRAILADIDGDRQRSADAFAAADERLDLVPDPMGRIWTRLAWGLTCLRRRDAEQGLALWELARQEMRSMGAAGFAELLTTVLRRISAEIQGLTGDPLAPLTEQQRRVAGLVAQGYTSAEIAVRLFLTKRTVDFHVANVVTRLGLGHRREIKRFISTPSLGAAIPGQNASST